MNSKPGDAARQALKGITQPARECVSVDRFAEGLTSVERDHVAGCARCQTEAALWNSLNDTAPRPDEGAAVPWIVQELKRRNHTPAAAADAAGIGPWRSWRLMSAIGAAIALVLTVGYVTRDREPVLSGTGGAARNYRSGQLELRSPIGDQSAVPLQLEWMALPGAVGYDVSILEVDRTVLWSGSATGSRLALPSPVRARLVPGKTMLWEVTARDGSGKPVAVSGMQSFRVIVDK